MRGHVPLILFCFPTEVSRRPKQMSGRNVGRGGPSCIRSNKKGSRPHKKRCRQRDGFGKQRSGQKRKLILEERLGLKKELPRGAQNRGVQRPLPTRSEGETRRANKIGHPKSQDVRETTTEGNWQGSPRNIIGRSHPALPEREYRKTGHDLEYTG